MLLLDSDRCAVSCVAAASEKTTYMPCDKHTYVNDHQKASPTLQLHVCRQADPTISADGLGELQLLHQWLSPGCVAAYNLPASKPMPAVGHPDL